MKNSFLSLLALGVFGCAGEAPEPDLAADLRLLEGLHAQQRQAHFEKRADLFVATFADPILQLKDGKIRPFTREESLGRSKAYFAAAQFLEWDDLEKPVIRISRDGTMAYVLVNKRVRLLSDDDGDGRQTEEHAVYAWMEAWEKLQGAWKLTATASTEKLIGGKPSGTEPAKTRDDPSASLPGAQP